jgi:hypothetical protein
MKKMAAGSFKTNCLAVMDEVQAKHEISSQARAPSKETLFPPRFHLKSGANSNDSRRYACRCLAGV